MERKIEAFKTKGFSKIWVADQGDGTFKNPIIYADYSDPDVIRVGEDFFMTASSFNCSPGLPLLHSKDLVNWKIVNNIIDRLPFEVYDKPQYGKGIWAPSLRYHANKFWVFFPTPDEGMFMTNATDPYGKWSEPTLVKSAKGLIDPCPFWDEDGKAYLVHAFAGSRVGNNYEICVPETSDDFISEKLGLQWQWNANFKGLWYSLKERKNYIRLYAVNDLLKGGNTLCHAPNLLLQKYPAPSFTATTKLEINVSIKNVRAGLAICGNECHSIAVYKDGDALKIGYFKAYEAKGIRVEEELEGIKVDTQEVLLRVNVELEAECTFSYSLDKENFIDIGETFKASKTLWMGSKVGIFCVNLCKEVSTDYGDFDWFIIEEK